MSPTKTFHAQRSELRGCLGGTIVQRDEFFRLLVSFRKMVRSDESTVRGLLDVETGKRFLIEREKLFER